MPAAKTKKLAVKIAPAKIIPVKAIPAERSKTPEVSKPAKRSKMTPIREARCVKCDKMFKTTNPDAEICGKCDALIKADSDPDAPRIECRLLIGDLSLPIDPANLDHTLGTAAAEWAYGKGLVDSWPDAAWVALLAYLDLPADPLDRSVAALPVKRLVQKLWYKNIKGYVPDEVVLRKRDEERSEEYEEKFVTVKESSESRSEKAKTNFAKAREARGDAPRTNMGGKRIKVVNAVHTARPGTKRQIGLDIILKAKTTDEAIPLLVKAGCNSSFITFAVKEGFIELL